jgi:branched-chain amino acid transport system substrate-binding protein
MNARRVLTVLAVSLALLAASCGGDEEPLRIGVLTDCEGFFAAFNDIALAGSELPLIRRGATLAGSEPAGGLTEAAIAGRQIELSFGCASDATSGSVEIRRLVEGNQVDVVVGSNFPAIGRAFVEYASLQPGVTFVIPQGEQLDHLDPGPNVFRFSPTFAQQNAGLGTYAFGELGWRRAVTITTADGWSWGYQAGFAAEFCSLGGEIVDRVWLDTFPENVPDRLAAVPSDGVDGYFLAVDPYSAGVFLEQQAGVSPALADRVIAGGISLPLDPAVAARLGESLVGLVSAGDIPFAAPPPAFGDYGSELERAFPELAGLAAGTGHYFDLPYHNAMEAVLQALEEVEADLSDGQRRFRAALGEIELDAPNGPVRLDANRQAIASTYVHRVAANDGGAPSFEQLRAIDDVDASFAGRLSPDGPAPSRSAPSCEPGSPPAWAGGDG